ncbi:GlyGly-CTERM sorting domain-containing protein [Salmonella sp. s51090]
MFSVYSGSLSGFVLLNLLIFFYYRRFFLLRSCPN